MSRTYAHFRHQARSFARLYYAASVAAPLVVGGVETGVLLLPIKWVPAIRGYHITLSGYHLAFKRVPHSIAKAGVLLRLLVLARMWEDWLPHLKGSITAGARDRGAGKFASTQKGGPYTGWTLHWVDINLGGP